MLFLHHMLELCLNSQKYYKDYDESISTMQGQKEIGH